MRTGGRRPGAGRPRGAIDIERRIAVDEAIEAAHGDIHEAARVLGITRQAVQRWQRTSSSAADLVRAAIAWLRTYETDGVEMDAVNAADQKLQGAIRRYQSEVGR